MSAALVTPMRTPRANEVVWLSPEQVCESIPGMTVRKLQRHRDNGTGPAYSKDGMTIVYDLADVTSWMKRHRVSTREQS